MMRESTETAIGAGVLLLVAAVISTAYIGASRDDVPGYDLTAEFHRIDGLRTGAQVRMAGVVVGKVAAAELAPGYRPVVSLRIQPGVGIPADSAALIHTDGLLGEKFIEVQPGGDEANLGPGDRLAYSQDSVVLQDLLEIIMAQVKARNGGTATQEEPAR